MSTLRVSLIVQHQLHVIHMQMCTIVSLVAKSALCTSCIVFCIGVPVSRSRLRQLKLSKTFQRRLSNRNSLYHPKYQVHNFIHEHTHTSEAIQNFLKWKGQKHNRHTHTHKVHKQTFKTHQLIINTTNSHTYTHLLLLLMAWASSRIMYCHLTLWKYLTSCTTSW